MVLILDGVQKTAEDYWKDLPGKGYIHAVEFANDVASDLIAPCKNIVKKESSHSPSPDPGVSALSGSRQPYPDWVPPTGSYGCIRLLSLVP
jgi:hypothetical protein